MQNKNIPNNMFSIRKVLKSSTPTKLPFVSFSSGSVVAPKDSKEAAEFKPTSSSIQSLRKRSEGISLQQCRRALVHSYGDEEKAFEWLLEQNMIKGESSLKKRSLNSASCSGIWHSYSGDGYSVLLQILCETDFVAKNALFRSFAEFAARKIILDSASIVKDAESKVPICMNQETITKQFLNNGDLSVELKNIVGRLGEKIVINQCVLLEDNDNDCDRKNYFYVHNDSYAGYLTFSRNGVVDEKACLELVQHFVGFQPETIDVFLQQQFLFDPSKKICTVLEDNGLKLIDGKWFTSH